MSLPVGRIQCREHPGYIGARMTTMGCDACDFIYFMRKRSKYHFDDESCVEVRKLVLRKKK
jgi:hypothetical protein